MIMIAPEKSNPAMIAPPSPCQIGSDKRDWNQSNDSGE